MRNTDEEWLNIEQSRTTRKTMAQRTRLLLLIPHLGGGGAEQVTALLVRKLSPEKYDLHLTLVTQTVPGPSELPEWLAVHAIGARRVRLAAIPLLRLVRRLHPDVILSGMAHLNFLVLLLRPFFPRRTRVLVRQNSTVSSALAADRRPRLARFLYRLLYHHSDRVICQSGAMADDLAAELGIATETLVVLPNPIELDRIRAACDAPSLWQGTGPHLLAVGRLAHEKGFDLLLEAFAAVRRDFPHADLVIAGEGAQRAALEAQACRLGLDAAVQFAGYVDMPYCFYPGATLFVLPSRQEGMPNALLEAAAAGIPLVTTPASGGIVDLLSGCAGAWLAPVISAHALAETLLRALRILERAQRFEFSFFSPAARTSHPPVPGQFAFTRAVEAYEALIDAIADATDRVDRS